MLKGHKWAFSPVWKGRFPIFDKVFIILTALLSTLPVIWVVNKWMDQEWYYGLLSAPVFLVVCAVISQTAKAKTAKIFQSAYFYEYRKVRFSYESKGNFRNEADVQNRTVWSYTKKLKNAEAHGRLWRYVNAMAKTKKIAPDIYAETMYV